jgi:hypothetical protein
MRRINDGKSRHISCKLSRAAVTRRRTSILECSRGQQAVDRRQSSNEEKTPRRKKTNCSAGSANKSGRASAQTRFLLLT